VIVLINGGPALDRFGPSPHLGRLVSPRSGNLIRPGERWAADNDAFLAWDEGRFRAMLARLAGVPGCLFVGAPDIVGDAGATLLRFPAWRDEIASLGFPVALVGQDGAESIEIPWGDFDAWFIGGSTDWKLSPFSARLATEAKGRGKWVHMGRVNTLRRLRIAYDFGCDSVDGTGWSKFPDIYLAKHLPYVARLHRQGTFAFSGGSA
jgi:hypothetical protein